ncbi:MAG: hypothetical protein WCP22_13440 [Chlamydiota bacterium]
MRTAVCVFFVAVAPVLLCASSRAQDPDLPSTDSSGYAPGAGVGVLGPVPTKRPLRPIPGHPQGGGLTSSGTYGGVPGVSLQQSNPLYPTSRTYYEHSPNAARPDSYGRMRSVGGPDVDTRGGQMGADWYRNMPAPNYDYRNRRY